MTKKKNSITETCPRGVVVIVGSSPQGNCFRGSFVVLKITADRLTE